MLAVVASRRAHCIANFSANLQLQRPLRHPDAPPHEESFGFSRQPSKELIFDFIGLVSVLEAQGAVPPSFVRSHV